MGEPHLHPKEWWSDTESTHLGDRRVRGATSLATPDTPRVHWDIDQGPRGDTLDGRRECEPWRDRGTTYTAAPVPGKDKEPSGSQIAIRRHASRPPVTRGPQPGVVSVKTYGPKTVGSP